MVGIPKKCETKRDWQNAVSYAIEKNVGRSEMYNRLKHLRDDYTKLVLKASSQDVPAEEQTVDDFESVEDPAAEKFRLGFTNEEINKLMEDLK